MNIIINSTNIGKNLFIGYDINITFLLTTPQLHHLILFILVMVTKGFGGKINDLAELMPVRHRTNFGKFLSKSPWDEKLLERALKKYVLHQIWNISKNIGNPIYVVIDDTISEKTPPSSKAKRPTEKCGFHNSHLKGKTVYGHQLVTVMLSCGKLVLPFAMIIYDKTEMSKIQIAMEIIASLPKPVKKGYVLCDSWYIVVVYK